MPVITAPIVSVKSTKSFKSSKIYKGDVLNEIFSDNLSEESIIRKTTKKTKKLKKETKKSSSLKQSKKNIRSKKKEKKTKSLKKRTIKSKKFTIVKSPTSVKVKYVTKKSKKIHSNMSKLELQNALIKYIKKTYKHNLVKLNKQLDYIKSSKIKKVDLINYCKKEKLF